MSRCSIVIPVFNKANLTRQCLFELESLGSTRCETEIIVVDDASTDETQLMLEQFAPRVKVVRQAENRGYAHACNAGASSASGEYLVFLNNDTIPTWGWLDSLIEHAKAHPRAAAVGSKLLYLDGTIQHAGMVIDPGGEPWHLYRTFAADHPAVNKARRFKIVTGASMLMRREAFDDASGFDTAFRNGYEDVDLCLRLGALNWEVHYCPSSVLYHLESVSEGRTDHQTANHRLYRDRWADKVKSDLLEYYLEDGLLEVTTRLCHVDIAVSPLIGRIRRGGDEDEVERLLSRQTERIFLMMREVIKLRADQKHQKGSWVGLPVHDEDADASSVLSSHLNSEVSDTKARSSSNGHAGFGVNALGLFESEKGMGEAARSTIRALEAVDIPHVLNNFVDEMSANNDTSRRLFTQTNPYHFNLLHINADTTLAFGPRNRDYFHKRYNIGYWNWELSWFPEEWSESFDYYDEVWVPSTFTRQSVASRTALPVHCVPYSIQVPRLLPAAAARQQWGLPQDAFLFLFAYDFHSFFARKNPLATLEAFRLAFGDQRDVHLVLKSVHGSDAPRELEQVVAALRGHSQIHLVDRVVSRSEMSNLMQACDAYVSLHRSEGFGLLMAEAMAMGKPVIATDYSANRDYLTAENGLPVRYQMVEIERDHGPYRKGAWWAEPDVSHAAELMRRLVDDPELGPHLGQLARRDIEINYSPERVGGLIMERLVAALARHRDAA